MWQQTFPSLTNKQSIWQNWKLAETAVISTKGKVNPVIVDMHVTEDNRKCSFITPWTIEKSQRSYNNSILRAFSFCWSNIIYLCTAVVLHCDHVGVWLACWIHAYPTHNLTQYSLYQKYLAISFVISSLGCITDEQKLRAQNEWDIIPIWLVVVESQEGRKRRETKELISSHPFPFLKICECVRWMATSAISTKSLAGNFPGFNFVRHVIMCCNNYLCKQGKSAVE